MSMLLIEKCKEERKVVERKVEKKSVVINSRGMHFPLLL